MAIGTMKMYFSQTQAFAFLTILIFGTYCNGQVRKDLPKEKVSESEIISAGQPKLIKTQGSQPGDNVHCSLQDRYDGKSFTTFTRKNGLCSDAVTRIIEDKKGNLWFGGDGGICRYNGKSFTSFATKDGLINGPWSILEDKTGNLWIGSNNTGLYRFDGKTFTSFSE